jgi:hypothetical protein
MQHVTRSYPDLQMHDQVLDHLVGTGGHPRGMVSPSDLEEVDDQLELGRLHRRKAAGRSNSNFQRCDATFVLTT